MKVTGLLLAFAAAASSLSAQAAPRVAATFPPAELAELEAIREKVWVNWFAGDTTALRQVLAPELLAISGDSPDYQSLEQTLAGSAQFKASGAVLKSVTFTSPMAHRFGDVVVMFSHYALEIDRNGQQAAVTGRATEVFVRHNGRWVHTSWHLDELGD